MTSLAEPAAGPSPRFVTTPDGLRLATYEVLPDDAGPDAAAPDTAGPDHASADAPVVLAVHGFASSFVANFVRTGWTRDLTRAGIRVLGIDQRGHGASDKPHDAAAYSVDHMVADVISVLDTYSVGQVAYVGYSLGARVGWHVATERPELISRAVLGGIPDGAPLERFRTEQAYAALETGDAPPDAATAGYLTMAAAVAGNDVRALVAVAEGLQDDVLDPDDAHAPQQPVLFATGDDDDVLEGSRRLAEAAPAATFYVIPGRHHFNAPISRQFRAQAVEYLRQG